MSPTVHRGVVDKNIKMTGKTVIITGANTGIGLANAIDMARREARVIMACRNMEKGQEAKGKVIGVTGSELVVLKSLDLASFESIREFADDVNRTETRLDVLINNAGIMMCPKMKTKNGFEMQMGVNHLGHFLLTNLLLDLLKESAPSRVVTVSSTAHYRISGKIYWDDINLEKSYSPSKAYGQSKLMNVLFSRELSKRLKGTGVTTYACEPGVVDTELGRHIGTPENGENLNFWDRMIRIFHIVPRWFYRTPEQGAQTQIYCAVAPELADISGKYYASCKETGESWDAQNDEYAERLWEISEKFIKCEN